MTRIERSVEIDAPVGDVFALASDWERWSTWFEGVLEFEPVTVKEHGNGACYAYRGMFGDRQRLRRRQRRRPWQRKAA